jgi:hypothetical protein
MVRPDKILFYLAFVYKYPFRLFLVIPAKAGIQYLQRALDAGSRPA